MKTFHKKVHHKHHLNGGAIKHGQVKHHSNLQVLKQLFNDIKIADSKHHTTRSTAMKKKHRTFKL